VARPRSALIGHTRWKVLWSQTSVDALHEGKADAAVGITVEALRTIAVSGDLVADAERETFLHELLHACISASGLSCRDEERLVSVLAPRLLEALRHNPVIVAYLLDE
jgi:hypothetical protein